MKLIHEHSLCFDDVLLIPQFGTVASRQEIDLSTELSGVKLNVPIIAANMSTVCESEMAVGLGNAGGMGIIHRFMPAKEQLYHVVKARESTNGPVGFSVGIGEEGLDRFKEVYKAANLVCVDVAHGFCQEGVKFLLNLLDLTHGDYPIMFGQVTDVKGLFDKLPDAEYKKLSLKTSIGGGSMCTTRIMTGFGVPTLQAVMDCSEYLDSVESPTKIIADGGIKNSGDIVKSLAAGASAVMLGKLLSCVKEAPGKIIKKDGKYYKLYAGSASYAGKQTAGLPTTHIEGESQWIEIDPATQPSVADVVKMLCDGIRSGISYGGGTNIYQLQLNAKFSIVSGRGFRENTAHGLS